MDQASLNSSVRLKGDSNWNVWKFQIKVLLNSRRLYGIVCGDDKQPEIQAGGNNDDQEKLLKEWKTNDSKTQEIIVTRIEEGPMIHILNCETANQMWTKLLSVYEKKSEVSLHLLQQQFFNMTYEGGSMSEFISKIEDLTSKLKQLGENVSEQMIITKILISLPGEFKYFVSAWESVPSNEQKLSQLTARLLIEEERSKSRASEESMFLAKRL